MFHYIDAARADERLKKMCDYCSWIEGLLRTPEPETVPATICTNVIKSEKKGEEKSGEIVKFVATILVHGTADSTSSRDEINELLARIEEATIEAYKKLVNGAETADALETAIRRLEDEKSISDQQEDRENKTEENRAKFTRDAAIMDSDSNAGSVGGVTNVQNPITLAKKVMRNTDHILIVENGAENLYNLQPNLAVEIERSGDEKNVMKSKGAHHLQEESEKGKNRRGLKIYGAVARDRKGRLSCGVSTFDDRDEIIARSSMSASGTVLGCGIFADAKSCCTVSGTDAAIYKYAPARKIVERLNESSASLSIEQILEEEINQFVKATPGESLIGIAALDVEEDPQVAFKSDYFPWACCNRGIMTSGCVKGEVFTKNVQEENLEMPLDCECH